MTTINDFDQLSEIDHVRQRPDTYIGSITNTKEEKWIIKEGKDGELTAEKSEVRYNPGLEQCIVEIITNATDHVTRCLAEGWAPVKKIKINIDDTSVSVLNDGPGIPTEIHPKTKIHLPEMIFGNLRTGSNFDDKKKKTWGGKNGYGAKLANIFSTRFVVECQTNGKNYIQEFSNGMTEKTEPKITSKKVKDYTKITYFPDFEAFKMKSFKTNLTRALIKKRVYDSSAVTGKSVNIYFNDNKLPIKDFSDYMNLYIGKSTKKVVYNTNNWEVGFALCPYDEATQISFVNTLCTDEGGSHVNHVLDPVLTSITKTLQDKVKGVKVKKEYVKENVIVFVNALIENPNFNSQTKKKLTSKISEFGSRCDIPEKTIKQIAKLGITNNVLEIAKAKDMKKAMKTLDGSKKRRLTDIDKLSDANWAGKKPEECTLILTEGDSAMGLAINGINEAGGRNKWGVFPLRGKFLNIRKATAKDLTNNKEMTSINRILGLKEGLKDITKLRYHRVMLLTDSDVDGFHIKGLLINYFTYNWPELVEQGLVECLITPVIKVFKGKQTLKQFYNVNDYKKWIRERTDSGKIRIKYYKGLGTSNKEEAKEYFSDLKNNRIKYKFKENEHIEKLVLAFDKDYADQRKEWITTALQNQKEIDYNKKNVKIDEFIDKELVQFSIYDVERSIPNVIDGLKPSQRKIIYACIKRNLYLKSDGSGEIKVAQLSGYISEHSSYHHGEASLQGAIVSMAQEFVGSGNMNLLYPSGIFGSRNSGGKDAASPRYIFTYLRDYVKVLFNKSDNNLVNYLEDDGTPIEPDFYVPVIPLILLNGSVGIGTGWSTKIPCFNPRDVIDNLRLLMENKNIKPMKPYYKGFKGVIRKKEGGWVSKGVLEFVNSKNVKITELPIGTWKNNFKEYLNKLIENNKIKNYTEHDEGDNDINYKIKLNENTEDNVKNRNKLLKLFKLESNISGNNLVAFDTTCKINKYDSAEDILKEFYKYRIDFYQKRKEYLENTLENNINEISERVRFVNMVINNELIVFKRKKNEINNDLVELGFVNRNELMNTPTYKYTFEEIEKLENELTKLKDELNTLKSKTKRDLWIEDLDKLDTVLF